jgi:hypothetical protein
VIVDARNPFASIRRGWKVREDERVLDRDLFLVVVAVRDPRADLVGGEFARDEPLMEGMLVVVPFRADGMQPIDEALARYGSQTRSS